MKRLSWNALAVFGASLLSSAANSANCPQAVEDNLNGDTLIEIRSIKDSREREACATRFSTALGIEIRRKSMELERSDEAVSQTAARLDEIAQNRELQKSFDLLAASAKAQGDSRDKFTDLGFGIGLGYSFGTGGQRVESAEVVNDIVRVTSDNTDEARIVLESHWFFIPSWNEDVGLGPFVSVNSSASADAISSFALGIMLGLRDQKDTSKSSWNIGLGYIWDSDVQVLGDGLVANQPLPEGEMEVRYKTESKGGVLVMFSRGF